MIQLECKNGFVMSLQHTNTVKGLPFLELLGRTSNNYCDGNENLKEATGLNKQSYSGGSRIFFRRGCTCLLLYFNTNKPHSFFLQNTSCIRKPQVIFSVVTQRSSLRDDTKNGCVADYLLPCSFPFFFATQANRAPTQ